MTRSASKLVPVMALLLGVWVVVYWAWTPRQGRITADFADPANLADISAASIDDVDAPVRTNKPAPTMPIGELKLGDKFGDQPIPAPKRSEPVVVPPEFEDYVLIKGDTSFDAISRRVYGTGKHAPAIARANPFVTPTKLKVGMTIRVPKDPSNIQGRVEQPHHEEHALADDVHVVRAGETLSSISKQHYGTANLWKKILDANRETLPSAERLKVGMELKIPPKD